MGMSKPPSLHSSTSDSALPAICKDLIGASIARLRSCQSSDEDESLADKLTLDLLAVHGAVRSIADLYEHLDDDGQENCKHQQLFVSVNEVLCHYKESHFVVFVYVGTVFVCSAEAQTHLVKATSAIERAVFITMRWISSIKPSSNAVCQTAEELKMEVKKIGGYLQLLIQVLNAFGIEMQWYGLCFMWVQRGIKNVIFNPFIINILNITIIATLAINKYGSFCQSTKNLLNNLYSGL